MRFGTGCVKSLLDNPFSSAVRLTLLFLQKNTLLQQINNMTTKEKTAVLLLGHGSRVQGANEAMENIISIIRSRGEYPVVEGAFLELSPPFIPDGIQKCIELGATKLLLVPYFLHKGRHIRKDIPKLIREEAKKYPHCRFIFGGTIDFHPLMADVIADRIREAEQGEDILSLPPPEEPKVIKKTGRCTHHHTHDHSHIEGFSPPQEGAKRYCFDKIRKQGVYDAIFTRRDVRHFRSDPVDDETLMRILDAAHHAPSVGYSQPWNFIVVRDVEKRKKIKASFEHAKQEQAESFDEKRREKYEGFKLEGILDAPVNICVTCNRMRFGPEIIGRHSIQETDLYSVACAVQNMWLAARAEGIGIGWVSIVDNKDVRNILHIPEEIVPVAYLCVGYPEELGDVPLLEKAAWGKRLKLNELVFHDEWSRKGETISPALET